MPLVKPDQLINYVDQNVADSMVTPEQYNSQNKKGEFSDASMGTVFSAGMRKDNYVSSYLAKFENLPSEDTEEEKRAFTSKEFQVISAVPEEHKNNPTYMREYYKYGTSQRKVDWVANNIYRQERDNAILDQNLGRGMLSSLVATLFSPEQLPMFFIPAGLLLKTGGKLASLTLPKAVAYESAIGGVSAIASEGLLHTTQSVRTKNESMYAVGASVLFSGMLTGVIGMATRDTARALHSLDKEMVDIDSNPSITSVGAKETDVELPKELEARAAERIDQQIADGKIKPEDRDVALQNERRTQEDTLSELPRAAVLRKAGWVHPEVRLATSRVATARVLSEKLLSSTLTRIRHLYGDTLGDALENTMSQFKYEKQTLIQKTLDEHYVRYAEEIKNKGDKALTYAEFSDLVGKANRAEDASDIVEVAAAAKTLRSKLSKPIEKRLMDVDLLDSYYSGFEALKREDFEDMLPSEELDKLFKGDAPIESINKKIPSEVMDELQRIGKLNKEAKIPKGDKSYFHRKWDFAKIENNPQNFLNTLKEAMRGDSIDGMKQKEIKLQERIDALAENVNEAEIGADTEAPVMRPFAERNIAGQAKKTELENVDAKIKDINDKLDAVLRSKGTSIAAGRRAVRETLKDLDSVNEIDVARAELKDINTKIKEVEDKIGKLSPSSKNGAELKLLKSKQSNVEKVIKQSVKNRNKIFAKGRKTRNLNEEAIKLTQELHGRRVERAKITKGYKISPAQRLLELQDDLNIKKIEHARYQEKQLDKDLDVAADEVKNAILGGKLVAGFRVNAFTASPLKERTFMPSSKKVDAYLVNNAEEVWSDYVDEIAPSLHFKERFGSLDLKDEVEEITSDYDKLIREAKTEKEATKIGNEKKQTLDDMDAMIKSLYGTYKIPDAPDSFLSKAGQRLRQFAFLTKLGLMQVSAIPDLGNIIFRHGLKSFGKSLYQVASMSKGMKLAMKQQNTLGMGIDLVSNITAQKRNMLDNNYALTSRVDRAMENMTNFFSKMTGMTHWNAGFKQLTGFMYANDIIDDAFKIVDGKLSGKKITQYARGGLGKSDMQLIAKAMDAQEVTKMDGVFIPNPEEWADQALAARFKSALLKEVDNTIVTPKVGDLPLMSRGEMGRLIFQFKSFAFAVNQRLVLASIDDFSAQKAIGILSMVMLGGVSQIVRDKAKGKETKLDNAKDWGVFMDNSIARSGVLAFWGDADGAIDKFTRGKFGLIPKFADKPLDRFASRNMFGLIAGPSAGIIPDAAQIVGALSSGEWRESDARAARRFAFFQNLSWSHRIFNKLEEAIGGREFDAFGGEK